VCSLNLLRDFLFAQRFAKPLFGVFIEISVLFSLLTWVTVLRKGRRQTSGGGFWERRTIMTATLEDLKIRQNTIFAVEPAGNFYRRVLVEYGEHRRERKARMYLPPATSSLFKFLLMF
jgi:hypothetical protein